jgi:hypothetical protein
MSLSGPIATTAAVDRLIVPADGAIPVPAGWPRAAFAEVERLPDRRRPLAGCFTDWPWTSVLHYFDVFRSPSGASAAMATTRPVLIINDHGYACVAER